MKEIPNELMEVFKKQNISIVFGGSGFIGLHLTKKLLNLKDDNHKVIIIDKVESPEIKLIRDQLKNKNDLMFFKFDMVADPYTNLEFLNTFYEEENGNNVNLFQLASSLGPENVKANHSILDYLINFNFYNYLVQVVKTNKITFNKIIFASTSEVYGNQSNMSETEDTCVNILKDRYRPQYALQKLTAENLLINFGKDYKQNVIVTRLFNIVGPNQKEGFVISNFNKIFKENLNIIKLNLNIIKDGKDETIALNPFNIYGDGKQSRVFTSVEDTSNVLHLLTTYQEKNTDEELKIVNSIINIACIKNNTTILKLVYKYLEFYKYIVQNIITDNPNFDENQIQYLKSILTEIESKDSFINFIEPSETNNFSTGALKRIPIVFKLYKILNYKPVKNINNIINSSLFGD